MRLSMISARRYVLSGLLAFVVTTLGGCVALQKSSTKEDDAPTDIRWFTDRMTDEGVIVRERGPAAFDLRSDEDVRMILDGTDLIDVYWFEDAAQAEQQAYELANSYPASRVYRRDGLVVVRYTDRAKGLSATLVSIMGARI